MTRSGHGASPILEAVPRKGSGPRRPLSDAAGHVLLGPQEVMQWGSSAVGEPGAFTVNPNVVDAPTARAPL
ncbi:hypothetical protein GCM10010177_64790 [Actinomadura citrea]|nr:hypothetical protein GCM10010177_64790 [Actinomadura citrea]